MLYLEKKTRFAAIQWTGSNQSDVEDFVALLPQLDPFYQQFTSVSVSDSSGTLTISWSGGSTIVYTNYWVVEGIIAGVMLASALDVLPYTYSLVSP